MRRIAALGIMLALFCATACLAAAIVFPPLTGRVVDEAQMLDYSVNQQLTQELSAQESRTGQQVVVAIVESLQGHTIEDYGYQLGRKWGIGQKDKDNGVILLVAPKERKVRIEVGYGLEGTLTDAKCSDIIQQTILPLFKQDQMQQGIVAGTGAILQTLGGAAAVQPVAVAQTAPRPMQGAPFNDFTRSAGGVLGLGLFLFGFLIFAMVGGYGYGYHRYGWGGYGYWGEGNGGGWGGGSGGFSGGGGSFGGGGASGSW